MGDADKKATELKHFGVECEPAEGGGDGQKSPKVAATEGDGDGGAAATGGDRDGNAAATKGDSGGLQQALNTTAAKGDGDGSSAATGRDGDVITVATGGDGGGPRVPTWFYRYCRPIVILLIVILALMNSFTSTVIWCLIRRYEFDSQQVINVLLNQLVRIIALIVLLPGIVWFEWKFAQRRNNIENITENRPNICYLVLICCLILITILLSIILFILDMIDQTGIMQLNREPMCATNIEPEKFRLRYAYTVLSFLEFVIDIIINIVMLVATAYIGAAWRSAEKKINDDVTVDIFYKGYENTGEIVSAVQGAFQPWFVLQWIAYFVRIFQQCQRIKSLIDISYTTASGEKEFVDNHLYCIALASIQLLISIFLFAIPYGCGIVMNKYHDKYIKELKNRLQQLLQRGDAPVPIVIERKKKIISFILEHMEYRFTPSIAGLSIPLDTVGHQMTILITIIAPLLSN